MTIFGVRTAEVSPWALREGVLLRRLDGLADPDALRDRDLLDGAAQPGNGAPEARRRSNGDGTDRVTSPSAA